MWCNFVFSQSAGVGRIKLRTRADNEDLFFVVANTQCQALSPCRNNSYVKLVLLHYHSMVNF